MKWKTVDDYDDLSEYVATVVVEAVREDPQTIFGFPTGRTPQKMYERVAAHCEREYRCFRDVVTFNLDEYVGIPPEHPGSYSAYMREVLFNHIDIRRENVHIPNGVAAGIRLQRPELTLEQALEIECAEYERQIHAAGGLHLTLLGLGRNGHIGFNEPGTSFESRTRVVNLHDSTRKANASNFPDGQVPERAITMGIATILDSREILLLVSGESKRAALAELKTGNITADFPASALHTHPRVTVIADRAACS